MRKMKSYTGEDITVLMSVYRKTSPEELRMSYESITIEQTVSPTKAVLIIDGDITDDLEKMIYKLKQIKTVDLTIVRMENNGGLAIALDSGLKAVKTELIARMDSDDISINERIEIQLNEFNTNPKLAVFGGSVLEFEKEVADGILVRQMPENDKDIRSFSKYRSPFNHPTVMFKLDVIEAAGGYIPLGTFEDYYLWVRLLTLPNIEFKNTKKVFVNMRAGRDMYARRASKGYINNVVKLRWWMVKHKIVNIFEFIIGIFMNITSILIPVRGREFIYGSIFRKKAESVDNK